MKASAVFVAFVALTGLVLVSLGPFATVPPRPSVRRLSPRVTPPITPAAAEPLRLEVDEHILEPRPVHRSRLLIFGAAWCPQCVVEKPQVEATAREVGIRCGIWSDCDIQLIDVDESPETTAKYRVHQLPAAVLIDEHGKAIQHLTGQDQWRSLLPKLTAPQATRSVPLGTLSGSKPVVAQLLDRLVPLLGKEGRLEMRYRAATAPVLEISGRTIRFARETALTWKASPNPRALRIGLAPSPQVQVGAMTVGIREVAIEDHRIVLDIPWFPDAEIRLQ